MICRDVSVHTPPTGVSSDQLKLSVSSILQMFEFLTIDILWLTANLDILLTF